MKLEKGTRATNSRRTGKRRHSQSATRSVDAHTHPFRINQDESYTLPAAVYPIGTVTASQATTVFWACRCAGYTMRPGRRSSRGLNTCGRVVGSGDRVTRMNDTGTAGCGVPRSVHQIVQPRSGTLTVWLPVGPPPSFCAECHTKRE